MDNKYDLYNALWDNDLEKFEKILDEGADPNMVPDEGGTPILLFAVDAGNEHAVRTLLKRGARPNVQIEGGESALHSAAAEGKVRIVEMLLEAGADVNAFTDPERITPLMMGARSGNAKTVEVLLAAGADINAEDYAGCTPLYWALLDKDQVEIVNLLLKHGADPKHRVSGLFDKSIIDIAAELNRGKSLSTMKKNTKT